MSAYSTDPRESHSTSHLSIDHNKNTFTVSSHGEDRTEKPTSSTGNCFITSACMNHYLDTFDDNCEELTILRWFRDNFVPKKDIKHYYHTAPAIVSAIDEMHDKDAVYDYIYESVVYTCVDAIKRGDYHFAYERYKNSILNFHSKMCVV